MHILYKALWEQEQEGRTNRQQLLVRSKTRDDKEVPKRMRKERIVISYIGSPPKMPRIRKERTMKKDLTIEMEEECITCPKLSLETHVMYFNDGTIYQVHQCEHINFCKSVRENWEKYHKAERETDG